MNKTDHGAEHVYGQNGGECVGGMERMDSPEHVNSLEHMDRQNR